jgi:hypothetical protein
MKNLSSVILSIVTIFIFANLGFADNYYVDAAKGDNTNIGTSTDAAWKTITYAVSQVKALPGSPAVINIAAGIYNLALGETFPINMKNNIQLIGENKDTTIIDATGSGTSVIESQSKNNVLIDGFTITGGEGSYTKNYYWGGGLLCIQTKIVIKNCLIKANSADFGGGLYFEQGSGEISNCIISDNNGLFGGGIECYQASPKIMNCSIENNLVTMNQSNKGGAGGGIYCENNSSPSMTGCTIQDNNAVEGGGIFCYQSSPTINDCTVENNSAAMQNDAGGKGGGIYCYTNSSPSMSNCTINNNNALWGGGMVCDQSSPIIDNCTIEDNIAEMINDKGGSGGGIFLNESSANLENCDLKNNLAVYGGGSFCYKSEPKIYKCNFESNKVENTSTKCVGGAIYLNQSPAIIKECNITGNIALGSMSFESAGGGIFCADSSPSIDYCIIENNNAFRGGGCIIGGGSSGSMTNCIITKNDADNYGGGLYFETAGTNTRVINCLINENVGHFGGAIMSVGASPKVLVSTIFGNTADSGDAFYTANGGAPAITSSILWNNGSTPIVTDQSTVTVKFSDIQYGYIGDGNISSDPKFVSGPWGDYYLSQTSAGQNVDSPCINEGSEIPIMGFTPMDYITRTDGIVDTGRVDMGYHYQPHIQFGLEIDQLQASYTNGDNLRLKFDVTTAPVVTNANIYLIMVDPDGNFYSAMMWDKGLKPLVQNLAVPKDLNIEGAAIASFVLPSMKPPISKAGTYTFYLAALKPGTVDFISNVAMASFDMQ